MVKLQQSDKIRALIIFIALCCIILSIMYFYPLALIFIAAAYFLGVLPLAKNMEGVFQEILYMGLLALIICIPIGLIYANS